VGFLNWIIGPSRTNLADQPIHIARGRGYTFDVVGESYHQDVFDEISGGKCEDGHNLEVIAQLLLIEGNPHDPNAVGVFLDGRLAAYIPRNTAAQVRADLLRLSPNERPITCYAKIVGGWVRDDDDEGHYGLKLSLSNPMRVAK
jgi:hypothetical protein